MTDIYSEWAGTAVVTPEDQPSSAPGANQTPATSAPEPTPKLAKIMIVDDEPINIMVVKRYLELEGYENYATTTDSTKALEEMTLEKPDIILLDIMMPKVDGLEILEGIRNDALLKHIPVIILTGSTDQPTKQKALELGATDFLAKPVDPSDLIPRVRNALLTKAHQDQIQAHAQTLEEEVRLRTEELAQSRLDVIYSLGRAAEFRDNETGQHVIRVGRYVGIIARGLDLDEAMVELLEHASPLHDVGKIGIPDSILLKPGKLSPEEFETMQKHCQLGRKVFRNLTDSEQRQYLAHAELGAQIIGNTGSELLDMAASIASSHHEKWDGSGYPLALAGEDIPLEGRITAIADVFDALSSKRPYKPAFPRDKCFAILEEGRGTHFDPRILDVFFSYSKEITKVQIAFADLD